MKTPTILIWFQINMRIYLKQNFPLGRLIGRVFGRVVRQWSGSYDKHTQYHLEWSIRFTGGARKLRTHRAVLPVADYIFKWRLKPNLASPYSCHTVRVTSEVTGGPGTKKGTLS